MSEGFVRGDIPPVASDLVVGLPVVTGRASVPDGDVISTREAIILIIVPFVWVGRLPTAIVVMLEWCRRNSGGPSRQRRSSWLRRVGSPPSGPVVAASLVGRSRLDLRCRCRYPGTRDIGTVSRGRKL